MESGAHLYRIDPVAMLHYITVESNNNNVAIFNSSVFIQYWV